MARYNPKYDYNGGYAAGQGLIDFAQLLRQGIGDYNRQENVDEESKRRDEALRLQLAQMLAQNEDRAMGRQIQQEGLDLQRETRAQTAADRKATAEEKAAMRAGTNDFYRALIEATGGALPQIADPSRVEPGALQFGLGMLLPKPKTPPEPPPTANPGQGIRQPDGTYKVMVPKEAPPAKPFAEGKNAAELEVYIADPSTPPEQRAIAQQALNSIRAADERRAQLQGGITLDNQRKLLDERDARDRNKDADKAEGELQSVRVLTEKFRELVPKVNYGGPLGRLGGLLNQAGATSQLDADATNLANLGDSYLSLITKIVGRQSGVLSDQDLERAKGSVPRVGDRREVAEQKLKDLEDMLSKAERNVAAMRSGGRSGGLQVDTNALDAELKRRGIK